MKKPTPGIYRKTPAGGLVAIVEATYVAVWHGPRGENIPQYAVERSANCGTALAWCYDLAAAKNLCRLLNGGEAEVRA